MGEGEVAKPLVNMTFATLLSYRDESESGNLSQHSWPSGFTKAEDGWVDNTEEGNTSFFSTPKEEQLKRKVPRRPRRGY